MARRSRSLRRIALGVVIVAGAVLIPVSPVRYLIGIHDQASLPERVITCDRQYGREGSVRRWSSAEIAAASPGYPPVVIKPDPIAWLLTPCVAGACTRAAQDGPCATVIWVRVDLDAFVAYALSGGP